jgi:hypothetical protein
MKGTNYRESVITNQSLRIGHRELVITNQLSRISHCELVVDVFTSKDQLQYPVFQTKSEAKTLASG